MRRHAADRSGEASNREDLGWNRPTGEHRQFLGKLTVFEGKDHQVKVSPSGDDLTWMPARAVWARSPVRMRRAAWTWLANWGGSI